MKPKSALPIPLISEGGREAIETQMVNAPFNFSSIGGFGVGREIDEAQVYVAHPVDFRRGPVTC